MCHSINQKIDIYQQVHHQKFIQLYAKYQQHIFHLMIKHVQLLYARIKKFLLISEFCINVFFHEFYIMFLGEKLSFFDLQQDSDESSQPIIQRINIKTQQKIFLSKLLKFLEANIKAQSHIDRKTSMMGKDFRTFLKI